MASFELELARQDADSAEAIARELSPPEPALLARVQALRAAHEESAALEQAARVERHERDPRHASAALGALTLGAFLVPMVVSSIGSLGARFAGLRWLVAEIDLVVLGAMVVAIFLGRKKLLANRYGRSATLVIFAIVSSGTFAAVLAAAQRRPAELAAPFTLAALAGPLVAGANFFGWPMAVCGIVTGLCAVLCMALPSSATKIVAAAELFVVTTTIVQLLRALRQPVERATCDGPSAHGESAHFEPTSAE